MPKIAEPKAPEADPQVALPPVAPVVPEDRLDRIERLVLSLADSVKEVKRDARRLPTAKKPIEILETAGLLRKLGEMKPTEERKGGKQYDPNPGAGYQPNDTIRFREDSDKGKAFRKYLVKAGRLGADDPLPPGVIIDFMRVTRDGRRKYKAQFFDENGQLIGEDGVIDDEIEEAN